MDISVVIPLYNEAESLPELFAWIERVMKEHNFSYEVIFINDGSTDNSWEVIEALKSKNPEVVHAVKFRRNYGKLRFPTGKGRCGHHDGCRPARQPRRDSRTIQDDHRRRL